VNYRILLVCVKSPNIRRGPACRHTTTTYFTLCH